jgi:anti-sigma-K factor RskA
MSDSVPRDPQLDALLGAYALDALDDEDRRRIEVYLDRNAAARDEVDELREAAASLALAPVDDLTAPDEVWNRIADAIASDESSAGELAPRRPRRGWDPRWVVPLAAAAAIAIVVLAVQVVSLHHQLDDARSVNTATRFDALAKVRGAREVSLVPSQGGEVARLVVLRDGTGYLVNDRLAPLSPAETYQLWVLMGDPNRPTVISAGVLGPAPTGASFRTAGPVVGFAVTIEHRGGVPKTEQTPIAKGSVA